MGGEMDKAVDMVRQLLADEKTKEKLSSVLENVISQSDGDETVEAVTDFIKDSENVSSALSNSSSAFSPDLLKTMLSGSSDRRVALLKALKPCLSDKRSEKVDGAITVMQLVGISGSMGITKLFKQ